MSATNNPIRLHEEHVTNQNKQIQDALKYSVNMLSIKDFIKVTKLELPDVLSADLMWNTFKLGIPVYITEELIRAFGYKGELKKQTQLLLNLVNKHNIPIIKWDNKEYKQFLNDIKDTIYNKYYPEVTKKQLKSKPYHYMLQYKDLKYLLLSVSTINGENIRKYFICIEEIFFLYHLYQCYYNNICPYEEICYIYNMPHIKKYNRILKVRALDKELEDRYKIGVIYFICSIDNPYMVKIGYTFNLSKRLCELQIGNYKTLIVKDYYFTQFPAHEEARVHQLYNTKRIRGEWFDMS